MKRLLLSCFVALTLFALPMTAQAQTDPQAASELVQTVGDEVVVILSNTGLSDDQRVSRLMSLLETYSDLELIGKLAVGRAWKTATPEQQTNYQEVFRGYVLNNLATQIGQYDGQDFRIVGATEIGKRDAQVRTVIQQQNGPEITVDWRMRDADGSMKMLDVAAEGISMVITLREEFGAIVNSQGFDGLIAELRARAS